MDSETMISVRESRKKVVAENASDPLVSQGHVPARERARELVPGVFDHQYAEYISGLKPPYLRLGVPAPGRKEIQDKDKTQEFNRD